MSDFTSQLNDFIAKAREHHLSDDDIRGRLVGAGWPEADVNAALAGDDLVVPLPPPVAVAAHPASAGHAGQHPAAVRRADDRPSITALQAALQHVLLWLFTLTSSTMITVVSFALFDMGGYGASSETLLAYVVLELVTFAPFAFFYWRYLLQLRKQPDLMTGKTWSIITVVLHSVGLIGSVVAFILVAILVHDKETTPGLISSGLIGTMNALVVTAYVWANFAKSPQSDLRRWYLQGFPVALFVLIAILGVWALLRVGPIRSDDQTRQNLVTAVTKIHDYRTQYKQMPQSLDQVAGAPDGVSYRVLNDTDYEICADWRIDHGSINLNNQPLSDAYASEYDFYGGHKGDNCWRFTTTTAYDQLQ